MRVQLTAVAVAFSLLAFGACDDGGGTADGSVNADVSADAAGGSDTATSTDNGELPDAPVADAPVAPDTAVLPDSVSVPDAALTPWGPNNPASAIGGARPVTPVLPDAYDPDVAWPLVIVLHGYTASGGVQDLYFGTSERGRELGFITLAPNGLVDPGGDHYWNASPACCDFYSSGVDDVGYIVGLIAEASKLWHIDPSRVYLIGHSNGAYMAHRLACDAPDKITAIAALAGVSQFTLDACTAGPPVSVLQMHGTLDQSVLYAGSPNYPGAETTVALRVASNHCDTSPQVGSARDYDDSVPGAETVPSRYDGCDANTTVELWTMNGTVHLPGFNDTWRDEVLDWLLAQRRAK